MKAALIIEEQIKEIEEVLLTSRAILLGERFDGAMLDVMHALTLVRSLKVQEPVAYGHWTSPAWSEEPVSLNTSVEKPSGFKTESANWFPLYAGETK